MIQFLSRKQQIKSVNDNKKSENRNVLLSVLFSSQLTISKTRKWKREKRNFIKCSIRQTLCYVWRRERICPRCCWVRRFEWTGGEKTKEKDVSDVIQFLKIYVFCVNNLSYVCISIFSSLETPWDETGKEIFWERVELKVRLCWVSLKVMGRMKRVLRLWVASFDV
jgi:hypothetical protein